MSSGLIAADPEGNVIACNRAAERVTEQPERELIGRPAAEVLGLSEDVISGLDKRLNERQIYRTERQIQVPSGEYRTIGMSITRVVETAGVEDEDEELSEPGDSAFPTGPWAIESEGPMAGGYIFMFQDLTDIKRMERMFWMRERMAVLGEMAGSLAHEIRNPLASISGSLQVLRGGGVGTDTPRARRLMDIVTKESERLSGIIEDFLDYTHPETLEAANTDLVELARDTIDLLTNSPEVGRGHRLSVDADTRQVHALVDPERIKQVFWNLARNAIQAMPEGGHLRVLVRRRRGGAAVVFEDEGVGNCAGASRSHLSPVRVRETSRHCGDRHRTRSCDGVSRHGAAWGPHRGRIGAREGLAVRADIRGRASVRRRAYGRCGGSHGARDAIVRRAESFGAGRRLKAVYARVAASPTSGIGRSGDRLRIW